MTLPYFEDTNYTLTRESPECERVFRESGDGILIAGWELRVPEPGPDGVPFLIIFVGPTDEHRGSKLTMNMKGAPDNAVVKVESFYRSGSERATVYEGPYSAVKDGTGALKRVEAGQDYFIRVSVTVPEGLADPDPAADESSFELECVKLWWNETA